MGKTDSKQQASDPYAFESLKDPRSLSEGVLRYVKAQKFSRMTPVQAATIPQFLANKDVAVQAVTGSGKTLAFLIPVVEILLQKSYKKTQIGGLVLSPTRELARQTYNVAKVLCEYCNQPEPLLLVGGGSASGSSSSNSRPVTADLQSFQKLHSNIVIGTPGRVQDILSRYAVIDTTELDCLILDEADVLLNMGFSATLQNILTLLPKMRRTALFSATQSNSTTHSLNEWMHRVGMRNPIWIDVAVSVKQADSEDHREQATPSTLSNFYTVAPLDEKLSRLVAFLKQHRNEKVIVFFLTCACVEFFGKSLQEILDFPIELLHGRMVQKRREMTMERFRETGSILFCTDVAARGLDVPNVQWVVQTDAPQDPSFFVHRVGRSARAGAVGNSLLFLTEKEEAYVDFLKMRKVPVQYLPSYEHCGRPEDVDSEDEIKAETNRTDKKDTNLGKSDKKKLNRKSHRLRSTAGDDVVIEDVLPRIRQLVMEDRDLLEKGTKAYTSYIRAYKEHHCAFIFRFQSLDLGLLATSFCLLRLPKMPELRDVLQKHKGKLPRFVAAERDVDIFAIRFKDKTREDARQKRLQEERVSGGKNAKLVKAEKRKAEREQTQKERAIAKSNKKRGQHARIVEEWDDLAKEERLYKKLRRGKITKEQYETQLGDE